MAPPRTDEPNDLGYAPKMTRVPADGITSFAGISRWTAMIVLRPVQLLWRIRARPSS